MEETTPLTDKEVMIRNTDLNKVYDICLEMKVKDENNEEKLQTARLSNYKKETMLITCDDEVIHRFCSIVNDSFVMINKKGEVIGDFKGWDIVAIEESKPTTIKHICMPTEELLNKATEKFGDKAQEVVDFIKDL